MRHFFFTFGFLCPSRSGFKGWCIFVVCLFVVCCCMSPWFEFLCLSTPYSRMFCFCRNVRVHCQIYCSLWQFSYIFNFLCLLRFRFSRLMFSFFPVILVWVSMSGKILSCLIYFLSYLFLSVCHTFSSDLFSWFLFYFSLSGNIILSWRTYLLSFLSGIPISN